ncbi:hypothetical protein GKG47_08830 [Lactonifactor sp. BIOML-A3]|uniref:hypothetical protein n=1 Tax=unclassified Lactonifactor TaxID=2636670 RepID=UPI0012B1209C|nr:MULTISPECIES: hypothetical protein [unclassified Lactonifactor]MSA02144.1 hypothetical protein [Lactonifactor sp. BIOML-A5]MSA07929.1 hypothetical protein [Lactonifactor sp. BIOML-A4]MSA12545.1 hypothetical protein [Lactonifactor sp. BIOML-A3]MSA16754.1 hypothetical protein [Lactonifactor sp. BIOML-A2]MSA37547.1 hypothetical protein [Lactonifactor sp. BIOML-A1]
MFDYLYSIKVNSNLADIEKKLEKLNILLEQIDTLLKDLENESVKIDLELQSDI